MRKETIIKFYLNFRLYIFPATVALASFFLIMFAIYPQTVKLVSGQRSTEELKDKSIFLETKIVALESLSEEDLSQKVSLALAAFPADKDYGNIFDLLQRLVAESGFRITSISLGNAGYKVGNTDSYEVKMEIQGSRLMFSSLLNNLENSSRLVRVNSLDISSGQASQSVDASLILGVLYSKMPQSFGAADSPLPQITQEDEELIAKLERSGRQASASLPLFPRGKSNPFE